MINKIFPVYFPGWAHNQPIVPIVFRYKWICLYKIWARHWDRCDTRDRKKWHKSVR